MICVTICPRSAVPATVVVVISPHLLSSLSSSLEPIYFEKASYRMWGFVYSFFRSPHHLTLRYTKCERTARHWWTETIHWFNHYTHEPECERKNKSLNQKSKNHLIHPIQCSRPAWCETRRPLLSRQDELKGKKGMYDVYIIVMNGYACVCF